MLRKVCVGISALVSVGVTIGFAYYTHDALSKDSEVSPSLRIAVSAASGLTAGLCCALLGYIVDDQLFTPPLVYPDSDEIDLELGLQSDSSGSGGSEGGDDSISIADSQHSVVSVIGMNNIGVIAVADDDGYDGDLDTDAQSKTTMSSPSSLMSSPSPFFDDFGDEGRSEGCSSPSYPH